jgi:hypothetical protein
MLLWAVMSVGCIPGIAQAYVMPPEQIVDLMIANFSKFQTLVVSQSTQLITAEDSAIQVVLDEKVWLKSPGHFYSELRPVGNDGDSIKNEHFSETLDTASVFYQLFLPTDKEAILALLSEMGVNLGSVAFTRYDGRIAYRLGDQRATAPNLLIEKDRFLPMRFSYQLWAGGHRKAVTVRFKDYRQVEGAWYPYEIAVYAGDKFQKRSVVNELEINAPIDASFFEDRTERIRLDDQPERTPAPAEEGRIRRVIELLREKYRQPDASVHGN